MFFIVRTECQAACGRTATTRRRLRIWSICRLDSVSHNLVTPRCNARIDCLSLTRWGSAHAPRTSSYG